jgi:outer membrane protein OmpA-like peptidoglycan-associated protein
MCRTCTKMLTFASRIQTSYTMQTDFIPFLVQLGKRLACCFLLVFIAGVHGYGQNAASIKKLGDDYFRAGRYSDAVIQYSQYQLEKPGDLDVLTNLGIAYFHVRELPKAVEYFEFVLSSGARNAKSEAFYYLAKSYQLLEKWPEAIKYYKLFLGLSNERHALRLSAIDDIKRCAFAREMVPNDDITLVQNLGNEVNTPYDEFAPVPSIIYPNRLFFSAAREESVGGRRLDDGIADDVAGHFTSDIFYAEKANNGSYKLGQLSDLINTARYEQLFDFAPGGKVMYYFRGFDLFSGDVFVDTAGVKDEHKLVPSILDAPIQADQGDVDLFVVHDSLMLFASRRAGGMGGLDLYYSIRRDDAWQEPINLGPSINSAYDDRWPFLTLDGNTLYFSTNRTESLGGLDVFAAQYDLLKKSWEPAHNLGTPLNSAADDTGLRMASNGKYAWFASDRSGGAGGFDLYLAYFKRTDDEVAIRVHPPFLGTRGKKTQGVKARTFKALVHTQDNDVLSPSNLNIIKEIAAITKANPQGMLVITAHIEENSAPALDAFIGIKRAQMVADQLIKLGIPDVRLTTRSCGAAYPAALNVLADAHNELAARYNNRVTVELIDLSNRSYIVQNEQILVPEVMRAEGQSSYLDLTEGLSYRVQFLSTNQMFTDDVLGMFTDLSIERNVINSVNQYRYQLGLVKDVGAAVTIRDDIKAQGFEKVRIVPYLYGKEINREEAALMRIVYPDLSKYLALK